MESLLEEESLDDLVENELEEEAIGKDNTDLPFADKRFTSFQVSNSGVGVLVYSMRVRRFRRSEELIQRARAELNFVYKDVRPIDRPRTRSYLGFYEHRRYVLGVCSGSIEDLEAKFTSAGFNIVDLEDKKGFQTLYLMLRRQEKPEMPTKIIKFDKVMLRFIEALTIEY